MPGAYADHEMPTMVPTVTIEDQLGNKIIDPIVFREQDLKW
jgi:hypothetical protein